MMTVFCEGGDYGYELAGVAMLFFRGEKVIPAKEGEEPLDNFILAETNLRPGRASLSVTVEREERTWEASEIVPVNSISPGCSIRSSARSPASPPSGACSPASVR